MKITVTKRDLLEALDRVKNCVATNKMIQLLTCFCFKDGKVFGFNGQEGAQTPSPLGDMRFAIEKELFYKAVSKMFDEIQVNLTSTHVSLKSGGNETKLQIINPEAYPAFLPTDLYSFCESSNVVNCLERVSFTMGTNPMKPQLLGACISGQYVYSADGKRLSRARLGTPAEGSITLPSTSVDHICKIGAADEVLVEKNSNEQNSRAVFRYEKSNTLYMTSLLQADFPCALIDSRLDVPAEDQYTVELPEELPAALERVNLLADEDTGLVFSNVVGKGLRINILVKEVGEADELIPWNCPHEFKFAAKADRIRKAFERTRKVDIKDVVVGKNQSLRFFDDGFVHETALILLSS